MDIERVPCMELLDTVFTGINKTVWEMLRLNVVDYIGAGLVLESITNGTKMVSIFILGNIVFKIIMALGSG